MPLEKRVIEAALTGKGFTRRKGRSPFFRLHDATGPQKQGTYQDQPYAQDEGNQRWPAGANGHAMRTHETGIPGPGELPLEPGGL